MNWFLPIVYFLILTFLIYNLPFFEIDGISRKKLIILFSIKICCGIILIFIYQFYYNCGFQSDLGIFHRDGIKIFNVLHQNPIDYIRLVTGIGSDASNLSSYTSTTELWNKPFNYNLYNDNRTIIRINAVLCLFSFSNFYVHSMFFTFFSFLGLTALYKAFVPYLNDKKIELMISIYLIPSVLLWTSGIIKESVVIFALGFLVYGIFNSHLKKIKLKYLIPIIFGFFLLLFSKFYFLFAILPGLIAYWWIEQTKHKNILLKFVFTHALCLFLLFTVKFIKPEYYFPDILHQKQFDFIFMVKHSTYLGSYIQIPRIDNTLMSLLKNSIPAFTNTLFRPHIFETTSFPIFISALENLLIICSLTFFLYFSKLKGILKNHIFLVTISFVVILFVLCGLITPVLGSLVRYRTPALPFLLITFLLIFDKNKYKNSRLYRILNSTKKPA